VSSGHTSEGEYPSKTDHAVFPEFFSVFVSSETSRGGFRPGFNHSRPLFTLLLFVRLSLSYVVIFVFLLFKSYAFPPFAVIATSFFP